MKKMSIMMTKGQAVLFALTNRAIIYAVLPGRASFKGRRNTVIKIYQEPAMGRVNLESAIISAFNRYFEGGSGGEKAGKLEASLVDAQTRYFQKKTRLVPAFQR